MIDTGTVLSLATTVGVIILVLDRWIGPLGRASVEKFLEYEFGRRLVTLEHRLDSVEETDRLIRQACMETWTALSELDLAIEALWSSDTSQLWQNVALFSEKLEVATRVARRHRIIFADELWNELEDLEKTCRKLEIGKRKLLDRDVALSEHAPGGTEELSMLIQENKRIHERYNELIQAVRRSFGALLAR